MGVFVDLCEAFDSLDRDLVLRKLRHYGLRGTILECIDHISVVDDRKLRLTSVPLKQRTYLLARSKVYRIRTFDLHYFY